MVTRMLRGGDSILKYVCFVKIWVTCMLSDGNHAIRMFIFAVSCKPACQAMVTADLSCLFCKFLSTMVIDLVTFDLGDGNRWLPIW